MSDDPMSGEESEYSDGDDAMEDEEVCFKDAFKTIFNSFQKYLKSWFFLHFFE